MKEVHLLCQALEDGLQERRVARVLQNSEVGGKHQLQHLRLLPNNTCTQTVSQNISTLSHTDWLAGEVGYGEGLAGGPGM